MDIVPNSKWVAYEDQWKLKLAWELKMQNHGVHIVSVSYLSRFGFSMHWITHSLTSTHGCGLYSCIMLVSHLNCRDISTHQLFTNENSYFDAILM